MSKIDTKCEGCKYPIGGKTCMHCEDYNMYEAMEDMTKYIGEEVKVWNNDDKKAYRKLLAVLPSKYMRRYITDSAYSTSSTDCWDECQPKTLEWYENPENYGKPVMVRDFIDCVWLVNELNKDTCKVWKYYRQLEEEDWKMI